MTGTLNLETCDSPDAVAHRAVAFIAEEARNTVNARGKFVLGVSSESTSTQMLRLLAAEKLPWPAIHIVQVDDKVVPADDANRNLTHLRESLRGSEALGRVYPMPVEAADPIEGAVQYAATLESIAGSPPVLDLIHLELAADGHVASLVPNDAVLHFIAPDVAITSPYQGTARMTLTYPIINRARRILWVVTGAEKAPIFRRLLDGDESIPAAQVRHEHVLVLADKAAAAELNGSRDRH